MKESAPAVKIIICAHEFLVLPVKAIIDCGDKFVRAIPRNKIRTEGIPLILDPDNQDFAESTRMVSFMIYLKNISTEEAQKVLEGLKSKDAQLTVFERTQSILVTDTGMNIKRMLELLKEIDVPAKSSGYIRYYCQPKFASCSPTMVNCISLPRARFLTLTLESIPTLSVDSLLSSITRAFATRS